MAASGETIVVGITGHRPNRLRIEQARLRRELAALLAAIRSAERKRTRLDPSAEQRRRKLVALTALAEGADRVLADAALEIGIPFDVLLPFPSADYETTFGDAGDTPRYRALLQKAAHTEEMQGSLEATKAAYEAVGQRTVSRSQIVVAVWDGKPAAGRGGTPEIIEHAPARNVPVVWIDATRDRRPALLRQPTAHGTGTIVLEKIARRAKPISWRGIGRLVAFG